MFQSDTSVTTSVKLTLWQAAGGRSFDVIVIGGGTFGAAIAEHIWFRQKQTGGGLRTLVLEAGLFTDPEQQGYDNTAYIGVNFGFEIQIDELARPDNALIHRTGAIYSFKGPTDGPLVVRPVGEWNDYEITVDGADLTVALNGQVVNRFHFTGDPQSPQRGWPSTPQKPRFIGLQTHTGRVLFRRIQWKAL